MSVATTLNIHKEILEKINSASEVMNVSRSEIIRMLLQKVMTCDNNKATLSGRVKYQESAEKEMWHKFHISFLEDQYEYFLDLRKLLKSSLSRLVAYAVKKYLNMILNGEDTDKSIYQNYVMAMERVNGVICWKLYWGIPDKIENIITL